MSIGRIWPSETVEVRDPLSGIALRQQPAIARIAITSTLPIGWVRRRKTPAVASDHDNRTNLFGLDLNSGQLQQLTDPAPRPCRAKWNSCAPASAV